MNHWLPRAFAVALWLSSSSAQAFEFADGRFTLAGFGQVAAGFTDGNLSNGLSNKPGFTDIDLTLLASARPMDDLFVSVQMDANPADLNIDWAFAEWRFSDKLRLRLGKVKQPFGLLGEVRDVGTLRVLFNAAESFYDMRTEFSSFGVIGLGVNGRFDTERGWSLAYDLYGGRMGIRTNDMLDQISGDLPIRPGGTVHPLDAYSNGLLGARLLVGPPLEGLSFAASAHVAFYGSRSEDDPLGERKVRAAAALSVQYLTDRWTVRSEAAFLYEQGDARRAAVYAEAGYFVTEHLQPALRVEYSGVKEFKLPGESSFTRHCEISAGLSYYFTRGAVARLEYHFTDGNLLDYPQNFADSYLAGTTRPITNAVLLGSQFSF